MGRPVLRQLVLCPLVARLGVLLEALLERHSLWLRADWRQAPEGVQHQRGLRVLPLLRQVLLPLPLLLVLVLVLVLVLQQVLVL